MCVTASSPLVMDNSDLYRAAELRCKGPTFPPLTHALNAFNSLMIGSIPPILAARGTIVYGATFTDVGISTIIRKIWVGIESSKFSKELSPQDSRRLASLHTKLVKARRQPTEYDQADAIYSAFAYCLPALVKWVELIITKEESKCVPNRPFFQLQKGTKGSEKIANFIRAQTLAPLPISKHLSKKINRCKEKESVARASMEEPHEVAPKKRRLPPSEPTKEKTAFLDEPSPRGRRTKAPGPLSRTGKRSSSPPSSDETLEASDSPGKGQSSPVKSKSTKMDLSSSASSKGGRAKAPGPPFRTGKRSSPSPSSEGTLEASGYSDKSQSPPVKSKDVKLDVATSTSLKGGRAKAPVPTSEINTHLSSSSATESEPEPFSDAASLPPSPSPGGKSPMELGLPPRRGRRSYSILGPHQPKELAPLQEAPGSWSPSRKNWLLAEGGLLWLSALDGKRQQVIELVTRESELVDYYLRDIRLSFSFESNPKQAVPKFILSCPRFGRDYANELKKKIATILKKDSALPEFDNLMATLSPNELVTVLITSSNGSSPAE